MTVRFIMPGLVPGIRVLTVLQQKGVDGRVKPGHDGIRKSLCAREQK
jgi:hypothetical protein